MNSLFRVLTTVNLFSPHPVVAGNKINIDKSVAFLYTNYNYQKEKLRKQSYLQLHKK